jgi:UDP-N-acetylmuramoyl-L-alanyl-D-glutamate--2,6-diaminopimelate ligase
MSTLSLPKIWPVTCHTDYVGKNSTFVAINGQKHNGADFIPLALKKGATTIIAEYDTDISQEIIDAIKTAEAKLEFVPNARRTLALRAADAWHNPADKLKIIGITGTKGKTTTSWLLHHLLQSGGHKTALLSTAGNKIGNQEFATELTTQHPDYLHAFFHACTIAGMEYVVMEVAAQAVSLHRTAGLHFDGIIFTNFAQAHGEFYATVQDYFNAKFALFSQAKLNVPFIINADDETGHRLLEQFKDATACSTKNPFARIWFAPHQITAHGIAGFIQGIGEGITINCPALIGAFNAANIAAAASMAWRLGIEPNAIDAGLQSFAGVPGRLEKHSVPNGAVVFIDYAHNPLSFQSVLPLLRSLTDHLIVVAGAGGDRDRAMRPVMGQLMSEYADQVFITSDNPRSENPADIIAAMYAGIAPEKKGAVVCELDREKAIQKAYACSRKGTVIALLGKGPDEYQIVGATKFPFSERQIVQRLPNP